MYKEYDDQELMYLIGEKNEEAERILYDKYKNLVNMKAKKYAGYAKKLGLEYSDLFQEGMVGLSEAIRSYQEEGEAKFLTFANLCIDRQIISTLVSNKRKKHSYLNESCSLDSKINDKGKTVIDIVIDINNGDPSFKIENEEMMRIICEELDGQLTPFEKDIFNLKMQGFNYKDIAGILNKSYKSIDSALQRIKAKVRKALENNK